MRYEYRSTVSCDDVGRRVTVRWRTEDGMLTDAVGVLERCDETRFWIRTRRGELAEVDRGLVAASKVIPDRT